MQTKHKRYNGSAQMQKRLMNNITEDHRWFNISKGDETAEVMIYDVIGDWWDGVLAKDFAKEISELDVDELTVRVNSPGGLIYEGLAIYNALKQFNGKVIVKIDAVAASIASIIAMAGDEIQMPPSADIMIHNPWSFVAGDANDMRQEANELDRLKEKLINIYAERTGLARDELSRMMDDETWMDGAQAVSLGFADTLLESQKAAACAFDPKMFDNIPERHVKIYEANAKRQQEKKHRDGGLSQQQAKAAVAGRDDSAVELTYTAKAVKSSLLKHINNMEM